MSEALVEEIQQLESQVKDLKRLVKMGEAVVEDFMPNIGACVLQDYGRLNDFLNEAEQIKCDE